MSKQFYMVYELNNISIIVIIIRQIVPAGQSEVRWGGGLPDGRRLSAATIYIYIYIYIYKCIITYMCISLSIYLSLSLSLSLCLSLSLYIYIYIYIIYPPHLKGEQRRTSKHKVFV